MRCRVPCLFLLFLSLSIPEDSPAQLSPPVQGGLFGSLGLGFMNLKRGFGLSVPAGLTAVLPGKGIVLEANLLDVGLLEGNNRDPRYLRTLGGPTGTCFDTETGYPVSSLHCSSGTDALYSYGFDVSYIPIRELWMGGKPGFVFTGLGIRLRNPSTPYATAGMYFNSSSRLRAGFKLAVGQEYLFLGLLWRYDTRMF